jgi:small-conductance mechanosensitive channel
MFSDNPTLNIIGACGIFVAAILLAWLVNYVSHLVKRKLANQKVPGSISAMIDGAVKPIIIFIVVEGLILALMSITALDEWDTLLKQIAVSAVILIATYGIARTIETVLTWQIKRAKENARRPLDLGSITFLKNITRWLIYAVGLLLLLAYLGIPISPLLASLGVGSLAVALALQPLLENFFAGTQIIADRIMRVGDFVDIDGDISGYVTDMGWRSMKIRTPVNNMVVIPNSVLAASRITNYNLPDTTVSISVYCGVSYESNLAYVKKVAIEVANEVIQQRDEAVKTFDPVVAFDSFGDSNVVVYIWIKAKDRLSGFYLKDALMIR